MYYRVDGWLLLFFSMYGSEEKKSPAKINFSVDFAERVAAREKTVSSTIMFLV